MKSILILAAALLIAAPAHASDSTDIMAAINAQNDALNRNDIKASAAVYAPQAVIIDEFAPHVWQGADAFHGWLDSFGVDAKARGVEAVGVKFSRPWHVMAQRDRGYAVIPAVYSYKLKGKLVHERGIQTFAMQKIGADWKIAG
jgi:hypothetical protein